EFAFDFALCHPEDRAVEENVLTAGQLRVKPGADFEQARDTSVQHNPAPGRFSNATQDLEKRALAGSVAPDNAQYLTAIHLETDILERPELLNLITEDHLSPADDIDRIAPEVADPVSNHIAQGRIALIA